MVELIDWLNTHSNRLSDLLIGCGVTLLVSWLFFRFRQPKRLTYVITTNKPIVSEAAYRAGDQLRVSWGDDRLGEPRLIIVRIMNGGRQAIESRDYERPVEASIEKGNGVIKSAEILDRAEDVGGAVLCEMPTGGVRSISLKPWLLNAGEWFDLRLVIDGSAEKVTLSSRISGQTRQMKQQTRTPRSEYEQAFGQAIAVLLVCATASFVYLLSVCGFAKAQPPPADLSCKIMTVLFVLSAIIAIVFSAMYVALMLVHPTRKMSRVVKRILG
jgi:hypothetical protein